MRVSVIVPTYRRPASLARCLDALARQERPAEETIVIVREGDEESRRIAEGRLAVADRRIAGGWRGTASDNTGPDVLRLVIVTVSRPGVVAAMNAGLDACTGDVVALTDDDAEPRADWLRRVAGVLAGDERIAAVGGRDWVYAYATGHLIDGAAPVVGRVELHGRVRGNHHIGAGPARDVHVLKGVNLAVRAGLLREIRFDERLRGAGAEHHWELALCLALRRRGRRVVYDPALAVDHYPQPRIDGGRVLTPRALRDSRHNETVALLEYLPGWRAVLYLAWASAIGTRSSPGAAQLLRVLPSCDFTIYSQYRGAQLGLIDGLRTYRCSRHAQHADAPSL